MVGSSNLSALTIIDNQRRRSKIINMSSNKLKSKQLGMPFGTASGRLRKQILFRYVVRCGDDICFKCKRKIKNIDNLSIEHKKPWQGKDTALFWDLDNIAFSHLECNKRRKKNYRHGSYLKYSTHNCRCNKCREAKRIYQNSYRKKKRAASSMVVAASS